MRSPYVIAIFHPLNLLMLGLSCFAGLVSAWWLFPIGLLLWAIMVVNITKSPVVRITQQLQSRAPLAQRFQRYFDRLQRAQVSVFNATAAATPEMGRVFAPVQEALEALADQTHRVCQGLTTLENYRVASESPAEIEAQLQKIEASLQATDDPLVQKEHGGSRYRLQQRLQKRDEVSRYLERAEARLLSLTTEIDGVVADVVRLQASPAQEAAKHVPMLVDRLRQQLEQIEDLGRRAVTA